MFEGNERLWREKEEQRGENSNIHLNEFRFDVTLG